ncbi:SDR family oxidoreductase [Mucilaginibacter sp. SG564]|uniref:SDR family oxidoreductase n=1 Tax=Mucilaginibacter sp. SG564 TaxID=2587022 RepID=UPI001556C7F1|nr:SDR family oxidoreductase [Mucilaginibacter sp. SG564]NOW96388.1 NAD(P)-dependent dehydrogenase (short-subunit alcohol dehydrogenase family) [Mucilaginibacter sp. SG564]
MNSFSLKNKVFVVTGGTGILGRAFIHGIAAAGGNVGILGRNEQIAEQRVVEAEAYGVKALVLVADVTKENELIAARDLLLRTFHRIDGIVNAAGGNMPAGVIQPSDDIFSLNFEGLRQLIELNLFGTMLPTQVFGKVIARQGGGSIVNISSMASQRAITKVLGYSLAKSAIDMYTKWFALELSNRYGDKLRVNAIAPGFFLTEQNRTLLTREDGSYTERGELVLKQTPYKRFGDPEELVGALIWLLSDASRFVNGEIINIDGGFSINSGV